MRRQLTELLRLCDLREDETALYLLLLKLRKATVPQLIGESGLHRMTVYRAIKRLQERNLLEVTRLNDKQDLYAPLSLDALINTVEHQERRFRRLALNLRNMDRLLPYMQTEEGENNELVEIRDGLDAFREEYLKFPELCEGEYLHIGSMENLWKSANLTYDCPEERGFIHKRMNKGVSCRIINIYSPIAEEFRENDSREMRTTKLTDALPIVKNYLGITEHQASYFLCEPDHPRVIVMKQPELVAMHKQHFEKLWKASV